MASEEIAAVRSKVQASRHSSYDSYGELRTRAKTRRIHEALGIALSVCGLMVLFIVFSKLLSD